MTSRPSIRHRPPAAASRSSRRTATVPTLLPADAVRTRAYEIYLERLRTAAPGDALADWIRAEREVSGQIGPGKRDEALLRGDQE